MRDRRGKEEDTPHTHTRGHPRVLAAAAAGERGGRFLLQGRFDLVANFVKFSTLNSSISSRLSHKLKF